MKQSLEQDILEAIKENDETRHELEKLGYTTTICTVCYDPQCQGEYTHYTNPADFEFWRN